MSLELLRITPSLLAEVQQKRISRIISGRVGAGSRVARSASTCSSISLGSMRWIDVASPPRRRLRPLGGPGGFGGSPIRLFGSGLRILFELQCGLDHGYIQAGGQFSRG